MKTVLEVSDLKVGKFIESSVEFGKPGFFKVVAVGTQIAILLGDDNREFPITNQNLIAFNNALLDVDHVSSMLDGMPNTVKNIIQKES